MKIAPIWAAFSGLLIAMTACAPRPVSDLILRREALPPSAAEDVSKLRRFDLTARDQAQLTEEFKGILVEQRVDHPPLQVGEALDFWYEDQENEVNVLTQGVLVARSDYLNMWIEAGVDYDPAEVEAAMAVLENEVIPRNRALFGTESQPGIDGDPRLNILHLGEMGGGVIGYFSSADSYSPAVNSFSNGRDMFYINLEFVSIGDEAYFDVVAHEYQHMIHWHRDRSEMTWLNEGLSELAAAVNGYGDSDHLDRFLAEPDTPLTYFDYEGGDYGATYLFSRYLYDRYGEEVIYDLVGESADSASGVEAVLAGLEDDPKFETLFGDWVIHAYAAARGLTANGLNDEPLTAVRFPGDFATNRLRRRDRVRETVSQFGIDFYRMTGGQPLTAQFTGSTAVNWMSGSPSDGEFMWTALPGDDAVRSLTHRFEIGSLTELTLIFDLWYDIELGWDFGYLTVSTDEGLTWTTLQTTATTTANPRGTNLGHGFTGVSGSGQEPVWLEQSADLTPFLGGESLLIRFLYVTDDAIFQQGMSIDHVRLPELGFLDSAENGEGDWEADGFVRHANVLPQTYLVQQILIGSDSNYEAQPIDLAADQTATWQIPLGDQWSEAIIAVSGTTPATLQTSVYELEIK